MQQLWARTIGIPNNPSLQGQIPTQIKYQQCMIGESMPDTIEQVQEELISCRTSLKQALQGVSVQPLDFERIVKESQNQTIDQILDSLPTEDQLLNMLKQNKSIQQKRDLIMEYQGESELVSRFQQNIENTKEEAVNSYYVLCKVDPPNLKAAESKMTEGNTLQSWGIKVQESSNKRSQFNMLRPDYRQYIKSIQPKGNLNLSENDVMVHMSFYDSYSRQKQNQFICHGGVLLSDLRDRFYCLIQELQEKNPRSGSFFFINNSFYNDGRYGRENASREIINVANVNNVSFASFDMETTRLRNLRVEIGKPYVWRHLKGCDHMIVFSEIRLYDEASDVSSKSEYPLNVFQKKINRKRCEGCKKHYAKIAAQMDRNKNGEDLYLCLTCHEDIHLQEIEGLNHKMPKQKNMIISKYLHE